MRIYTGTTIDTTLTAGTVYSVGAPATGNLLQSGDRIFLATWANGATTPDHKVWLEWTADGSTYVDLPFIWTLVPAPSSGTSGTLALAAAGTSSRNICAVSGASGSLVSKVWIPPQGGIRVKIKATAGTADITVDVL